MKKVDIEKSLKRFLKRKVSYSFALLVAFLISGEIVSASETKNISSIEETRIEAKDKKSLASLLGMTKEKITVEESKDKSTQFFFNVWFEQRKAKKYADNGFKKWGESNIDPELQNPDIEIPDIISPIRPTVNEPESPIENEDFIGKEPSFEFKPVGDIVMGEAPTDIDINVEVSKVNVSEIKDGDFNIFAKDSISNPGDIEETIGGIGNIPNLTPELAIDLTTPKVDYSGNITAFIPPEIPKVQVGTINAPASFSISDVKISATGFDQGPGTKVYTNYTVGKNDENSNDPIVIQNYEKYHGNNFDVYFNQEQLHYNGNKITLTNGNNIKDWGYHVSNGLLGDSNRGLRNKFYGDHPKVATFISDVRDADVELTGIYNIQYEGTRGVGQTDDYIRIFLSSNPAGIVNKDYNGSNNITIKITDFKGDLNLSTTEKDGGKVGGNLIGLEHQTWDKYTENENEDRLDNFKNSYSVLINSGTINLGKGRPNSLGSDELAIMENSKNMIGIMIDLEESSGKDYKNQNNKTINAGTINIYGTNSIGISFEEYKNQNNYNNGGHFILRDDAYVGKINVEGKNNYGFKMGNIFSDGTKDEFNTYFDETKVIGNVDGEKITIKNDNGTDTVLNNYTSKISVKGTENIGMVVGKSLSANANTNPIANFENISIEVNGEKNIGFLRDKNYSDNNKNDMVINDKNITDISFGENATDSVLIRSEQYGIKLDKDLDVSLGKAKEGEYNVALQATRQTWNNGSNDINSAGSVENSKKLLGTTGRMVGVMSSGTLTTGVNTWQNGDNTLYDGKALAKNSGTISLTGENNIGMAVLDGNSGNNTGTISIDGANGVGIYNVGGDITASGKINIIGNNSVGIYSTGTTGVLNLAGLEITLENSDITTLDDTVTTGIYISGGTVNFGDTNNRTSVTGKLNSQAGLYATRDVNISGYIDIEGTKVGIASAKEGNVDGNITVNNGHISYNGDGYALYTDSESKITLDSNSSLTLAGNAYGMNIDTSRTDKAIDFGKATINIGSNNVTIFNIIDKEGDYTLESGNGNLPGADSLSQYVGTIGKIESNGNEGYKIASVDGGDITLNSTNENNEKFLQKYKFQRSNVNVSNNINMKLSSTDANTYFNGEVVGVGQSSSQNINPNTTGDIQRAETTIAINGATVTADRKDSSNKATIGAYIDYGEISLTSGKIVVEDDGKDTTNNVVNNDGIGIYAKNGSKVVTDKDSSITVYGDNGVGIFVETTEDGENGKNKFGGNITTLEISNGGNVTLGKAGIGIYADNEKGTEKASVTNTGNITVGDSDSTKNISVGIFGTNTNVSNTGTITVGESGVGIYAENSDVADIGTITLGNNAIGVYVDNESSITNTSDISFASNPNAKGGIGIYFAKEKENTQKGTDVAIAFNFNIDMSSVANGRAVVSDGRNITLNNGKKITVSGDGGRGIRVANATATNSGEIIINASSSNEKAVGLLATDNNGTLNNSGTISVNGANSIGIYAENKGTDKTGNKIEKIGVINLGADKTIGVVAKNTDVALNADDNITFTGATNSIGIYAEGKTVTNNKSEFTVTGSETDKLENKNIGIYLGNGASYTENGSLKVENGAVGIYADKGASSLSNINILSDSKGVQTVGIVLNGEDKESKTVNGNITLTNTNNDKVEGKNIGIYAKNSTVNIEKGKTLTLKYNESNGTGIYLDGSALSGNGTIEITGKANSNGEISNSIGIYYSGTSKSEEHKVKLEIDKSNTIGVFASADSYFVRGANIDIGTNSTVEKVTGIVVSDGASAENKGTITLGNAKKGTGMAAVEGTEADKVAKLTNSGNIVISDKAGSGTGVFLSGNSQFIGEGGTITIKGEGTDTQLGIGIYALGENAKINSTGKFDMASGNVAVYSDGANISSNINLNTDGKNKGTTALVIKSDTNGTTVGGTGTDPKMNITLAENSTGIYALDSGVKIENVSIDATANTKEIDNNSYGIYLAENNTNPYKINNTDVSIVKGIGVVLSSSEAKNTNLNLTESNVKVNSYSEGAGGTGTTSKETGIGIYGGKGSTIALKGGNKLDVSYGTGIYSENGTISIGAGQNQDTINLQGYSVGLYSKEGSINLGEKTAVTFEKMGDSVETAGKTKGAVAYSDGGKITSSATIKGDEKANFNGFIALLGKNNTIENSGTINLTGEAVSGITAKGGNVTNTGTITVEDNDSTKGNHVSTGIFSEGASVDNNTGTINVNGASAGLAYTGTSDTATINAGTINVNGALNIGVSLNGKAGNVSVGTINGGAGNSSNLGVHINQFTGNINKIGAITLGDTSLGVYAENTINTINSLGQITVGKEGIGVAVTKGGNLTIDGVFKVGAGAGGTGVYVAKDSSLKVSSLKDVEVGEAGAMVHVDGGTLTLGTTAGNITLDNRIGIVLQNAGKITSADNSKISNMTVKNGGIGIVVKDGNSNRPDIFGDSTTITLGSGAKDRYSAGIYYQDAGDIGEIAKANIKYENGASHTIGTIFDNTYGTLKDSHITMDNSINNSIGVMIKKDSKDDVDKVITFTAGADKKLIEVNGDHNIGILGQDSTIVTEGNITVGADPNSNNSVGVYLTADNKGIKHTYTGKGDITVGSHSQGIYAKNYSVIQSGNIIVTDGVGIAGIVTDDYNGSSEINLTGNINIKGDQEGNTVGIYGKGTDIIAKGDIEILGVNNIGIFSGKEGDIDFAGEKVDINGAGSIGIYKGTEEEDGVENRVEDTTITVGKGNWNLGDKTIGVAARGGRGDSITITNNADMTLGAGAMGIYSVGRNLVTNNANINVGAGINGTGNSSDTASIGIYMANGFGDGYAIGVNIGAITVDENGAVGVQSAGYAGIANGEDGKIDVSNNGTGMIATRGGAVINYGNITVTDSGIGMVADGTSQITEPLGRESQAINYGNITLNKTENYDSDDLMIGMAAYNGGKVINGNGGTITVNAGTGMYFDKQSSFENEGEIVLNDGIGIMGTGVTVNNGGTIIVNGGTAVADPDNITDGNSQEGSIVADNINRVVYVNDNFVNVGGILKTDFAIKLNNPTVDITAGGAGFDGTDIEGEILLDSKFALTGNGISYSVEDFVKPDSNIKVNSSPLFVSSLNDGDLTLNKVAYRDITTGTYFDARDNALDGILVEGGKDADALKQLNYYLSSIKDLSIFKSEAERTMGELGGNLYANVQSRMQDINRAFDNSLDEMISSYNPAPVNDKFSLIYTDGEYENSNDQLVGYNYHITGLNYMREYEENTLSKKYGFNFGFAVSKFDFDDSGSDEKVYSLRAGTHQVKWFENGVSLTSKAKIGYNRHNVDRKLNLGYGIFEAGSDFNSYHVSLDNKLRKEVYKEKDIELGAYTGLNLEYGRFGDINEHDIGNLKVKAGDYMSSKVFVGTDIQKTQYLPNDWAVKFKGDVQYSYDIGENYDKNKASINNSGYYSLMSEEETKGAVSGKIGVSFEKSDYMGVTLEGDYTRDIERDEDYWRAGVRFTYKFH